MYECGEGVEKNIAEALKWYLKSGEQGYARAQCNLGWRYVFGQGVKQYYLKAYFWYCKAAKQRYGGSQHNLGVMYKSGTGKEQNDTSCMWLVS